VEDLGQNLAKNRTELAKNEAPVSKGRLLPAKETDISPVS
jgi:hypothetical protein